MADEETKWLVVGYGSVPVYRIPLVHIPSNDNLFTSLCGMHGGSLMREAQRRRINPKVCQRCQKKLFGNEQGEAPRTPNATVVD